METKKRPKIIFEFDDLHPHPDVDCLGVIKEFVSIHKDIVLNFFMPPMYMGQMPYTNNTWVNDLKRYIEYGNVCIGIHGYDHSFLEFDNIEYATAVAKLKMSELVLNSLGIKFSKVFRPPYWGINENALNALIDMGYTHLYSHEDKKISTDKIKIVHYNWNLKDESPPEGDGLIIAHGHTSRYKELSCGNSIYDHFEKISLYISNNNPEMLRIHDV